jgi:hypothetical protein
MNALKIRAALMEKGFLMSDIAKLENTSRAQIHSIVTGRTKSAKWRKVISSYAGKPVGELFPDS